MPHCVYHLKQDEKRSYIVGSLGNQHLAGPIQERFWLMSKGVAMWMDARVPLMVSMNYTAAAETPKSKSKGWLCLSANYNHPLYKDSDPGMRSMNYSLCLAKSAKDLQQYVAEYVWGLPQNQPNSSLYTNPVWSTRAYLGPNASAGEILQLVSRIKADNLGIGSLVIDSQWEENLGDLSFDLVQFPDPNTFIDKIHKNDIRVSLWVHPYVNIDSSYFKTAVYSDYLIKDAGRVSPGLTEWWNGPKSKEWECGIGGVMDLFDQAHEWLKRKIDKLQIDHKIDTFTFTGGETDMLPFQSNFHDNLPSSNAYHAHFAELASELGSAVQISTASAVQHLGLYVRTPRLNSTWDKSGLEAVIPTALTVGILGYPFIVPDVVGGSGYGPVTDQELYIRWLQVSIFMPVLHLSTPPFNFDNQTQAIVSELLELRERLVVPKLRELYKEAAMTLTPIIRPIWWIEGNRSQAFDIENQFLVGNNFMVAPVLKSGEKKRDIFLPEGQWMDHAKNRKAIGDGWLRNYEVALHEVPYFSRL